MDYSILSDEELEVLQREMDEEKQHRNEVKELERKKRRKDQNDIIVKNVDVFLSLVPSHNRTTCSDDNPRNHHVGCNRCILLQAKQSGYIDDVYKITIGFYEED